MSLREMEGPLRTVDLPAPEAVRVMEMEVEEELAPEIMETRISNLL